MKSLLEISKSIIPLVEGVFDAEGIDRLGKEIEKDATKAFLDNCGGKFDVVSFKDGSVRVNGKLIIKNLDTDKIYFNCRDFHGKLIIENCPKLTTLEDSFLKKMAVFDGSITINQCPALTSVVGLPGLIKGDLSITNCKKLKSYDGVDLVYGNFYWQGNGKKYNADELKDKVHVIKKIFCGMDDIEADVTEGLVTEAFNNPWLQRLATQFKKYPYKRFSWEKDGPDLFNSIDELFRKNGRVSNMHSRPLDKITSDDIDVYDMSNEKDKKDLAKAFYDSYNTQNANGADLMLVYNEEIEEFIGGFGMISRSRGKQNAGVDWLIFPHKATKESSYDKHDGELSSAWYTKTEAKEKLLSYGYGYTVVVINSGKDTGTGWKVRGDIKQNRIDSQKGVINPGDVEQYEAIARNNIKRYKEIIAQNKINNKKNDDEFDKLNDRFEQIMTRTVKLARAVTKNPKNFDKYDIDGFFTWLRDERRYNRDYKPWAKHPGSQYYGNNGLMLYFKSFMDAYMMCFGNSYKQKPDKSDYDSLENASKNLKAALDIADKKLTKFGV